MNSIAVLGGTGTLGTGLAKRLLKAGYAVVIGSRDAPKAQAAADELRPIGPAESISGSTNADAAAKADLAILTVPYSHHQAVLRDVKPHLSGKILIDATVPLQPPKVARVQLPKAGSAAVEAQTLLGQEVSVISAFQNVAAHSLQDENGNICCDILVSGNKVEDREKVISLIEAMGLRAWHAGPLANAAAAEAMTSVLIGINKRYGIHGAGIRISLPDE